MLKELSPKLMPVSFFACNLLLERQASESSLILIRCFHVISRGFIELLHSIIKQDIIRFKAQNGMSCIYSLQLFSFLQIKSSGG